jgi:hypothetical protein
MDARQVRDFFERVYLINLDSRSDRIDDCNRRFLSDAWPLKEPRRFRAIAGKIVPHPEWWQNGGGAWGVYRSNLRIIEDCLMDDVQSVLILEDDAMPGKDFAEKLKTFLEYVPPDWEQLYLGGQHLHAKTNPPQMVNQYVVRPFNVNRCHAYGLSREGMRVAYRHLTSIKWRPKHHIDHHYGILQQNGGIICYAPSEWMIGQADGHSDICDRELPVRFWDRKPFAKRGAFPTVIAVLGPYRSGTSAVAGAMHKLGIVMGHRFMRCNESGRRASPKGHFEAQRLFEICNACYPEPSFNEGQPFERRVQMLRGWLGGRKHEWPVIGAKHPKLCLMVPEMLRAWPGCKFVVVNRPAKESAESLRKLGWWQPQQDPGALTETLIRERAAGLRDVSDDRVLRISYHNILEKPRPCLEMIAAFAGIEPLEEQYESAIAHLDGDLKHYGSENACNRGCRED